MEYRRSILQHCVILLVILLYCGGRCQQRSWKQLGGPVLGSVEGSAVVADGSLYSLLYQGKCYYFDTNQQWHVATVPTIFYVSNNIIPAAVTAVGPNILLYYNTISQAYAIKEKTRGIYRSSDHGNSWSHVLEDTTANTFFNTILESGHGTLYAFKGGNTEVQTSIYVSRDSGINWDLLTTIPLPSIAFAVDTQDNCFFGFSNDQINVIKYNARTNLYDAYVNMGFPSSSALSLLCTGNEVLVRSDSALYSLSPTGSWHRRAALPPPLASCALGSSTYAGDLLYAGYPKDNTFSSLLHSTDHGYTWSDVPIPAECYITGIAFDSNGTEYISSLNGYAGMIRSFDRGTTWHVFGMSAVDIRTLQEGPQHSVFAESYTQVYSNELYWRYADHSYLSVDQGHTWENAYVIVPTINTSDLIAATYRDDEGGQYYISRTNLPNQEYYLGSIYYADHSDPTAAINQNEGIYCDEVPLGAAWNGSFYLLTHSPYYDGGYALLKTTDHGISWDKVPYPVTGSIFNTFTIDQQGTLYIGSMSALYRSVDHGNSWEKLPIGTPNVRITTIRLLETTGIIIGSQGAGVWRSDNRGYSWKQWLTTSDTINGLEIAGSQCYAATNHGLVSCPVNGSDWKQELPLPEKCAALSLLKTTSGNLYVSLEQNGLWTNDTGYTTNSSPYITSSAAANEISSTISNNVLSLSFTNPQACHISLTLYDLLGRKIATVADRYFEAGPVTIREDVSALASGTYIVVISGPGYVRSAKFIR